MDISTVATVIIAHQGMPCDPPIVEGYEFKPHPEDENVFLAEVPEDVAERWIRVEGFKAFGGKIPSAPPANAPTNPPPPPSGADSLPTDEAVDAIRSKADAAALADQLKIDLTGVVDKLEPMKIEIKAGLAILRAGTTIQ